MNVLLLYPRFPDTFWGFQHALKFVRRKAALPPLGLITVAAMLPPAWRLKLVDTNVRPLTGPDLAWADMVFVSAMIAQRASAHALIDRCHAAGRTVVAGGPLFKSEQANYPGVDHFVLDEAEVTLPGFLRDLERGLARRVYTATEFADLAETPAPRWDLLRLRDYHSMSVQYSRGCPFDCEFCDITAMFGHRPRTKRPAQILAELDALYARGWRGSVFFVDDNFIGNPRDLRSGLLPALTAWRRRSPGVPFYTEASINLARDEALTRAMVEAGFGTVFIGIETPDDSSLAECGKRQNLGRDLVADVKRLQRAGLQVQGGFIVGFDSDTPSIFQRQVDFIQRSGIITAMVGMLIALPGTRLHVRLAGEGRLLGESTGDNSDGTTNFAPRMGLDALREGYRRLLNQIYAPGPYYRRVRTFLREYRAPRIEVAPSWRHGLALLYASVRLGVIGRERLQFWGLLGWTLARRPAQFGSAVTFAIYGHHFRKVCGAMRA